MHHLQFYQGITRIVTDALSAVLAWSLAYYLRPWTDLIPNIKYHFPLENLPPLEFFIPFVAWSTLGMVIIFASVSLYSYPARYFTFSIVKKLLWGICLWILSIVAVYALVFHELIFSRIMLIHSAVFTIVFALGFRLILFWLWVRVFPVKKVAMVVGNEKDLEYFQSVFHPNQYHVLSADVKVQDLDTVNIDPVTDIFFFEKDGTADFLQHVRLLAAEKGKTLHVVPLYAEEFWGHGEFTVKGGVPMITTMPIRKNLWWFAVKRVLDIFISLQVIILFFPVWVIIAGLIFLQDRGNPFYVSRRVGRNGTLFPLIKFRSMTQNADAEKEKLLEQSHRDGPLFKIKNDPRVTSVGKFLRKTSLDEIPQFLNVLKGEMSVVGPRPHLPEEVDQYTSSQRRVLSAKPGITGLAQVSGRSDLSFERELFLDAYYAENQNFFLDIRIIIKTPFVLLWGKGAD